MGANVAIGMMGIGAGMNVMSAYGGAKSNKENLRHQAAINDINARMAERAAEYTMIKHEKDVAAFTNKVGQLKSKQRTAMAANGVVIGEGSTAEVLANTDLMKEINVNQMRVNAVANAWGYRMEGVNYQNQAGSQRASASSIDPSMAALSSLISGGGQVASSWYMMNN